MWHRFGTRWRESSASRIVFVAMLAAAAALFALGVVILFVWPAYAADGTDTSMNAVWLALIVAVPATLSAPIMAWMTNRSRRQDRLEDFARSDIEAKRADDRAKQLLVKTDTTAGLLATSNVLSARAAVETHGQLQMIHTLVNSDKTLAIQDKLDEVRRGLVSLLEIVDLKKALKQEPSVLALAEIEAAKKKIKALEDELADRVEQAKLVEVQKGAMAQSIAAIADPAKMPWHPELPPSTTDNVAGELKAALATVVTPIIKMENQK